MEKALLKLQANYFDFYLHLRHWFKIVKAQSPSSRFKDIEDRKVRSQFLLVRILGNDHPPRHSTEQTLNNLRFILENEPDFDDCRKLFILNRITDKTREQELVKLLIFYSAEYITLPFEPKEYARAGLKEDTFGGPNFFASEEFIKLPERQKMRMRIWALSPKICYAMNVNGARNVAVKEGRSSSIWTFALDGNCIFSQKNFDQLSRDCESAPYMPYVIIPMLRYSSNQDFFLNDAHNITMLDEPQIGFHFSAQGHYDERLPYGMMNKLLLLIQLGVRGPWQRRGAKRWVETIGLSASMNTEAFSYKKSQGIVCRLNSGAHGFEADKKARNLSRFNGILRSIQLLEKEYGEIDTRHKSSVELIMGANFEGLT